MTRLAWLSIVIVAACSDDAPPKDPPLAEVPSPLERLAVNDSSLFAIDTRDRTLVEIGRDGTLTGTVPTAGPVTDVVAAADWVAWIETEGTGFVIKRRKGGMTSSQRAIAPHIVATTDGLVYSDTGLVALWTEGSPERVAMPPSGATVLNADLSFTYVALADSSVVRYPRQGGEAEQLLASSTGATVGGGQLAHRTTEGIRLRDLFTGFDRVVGAPPADYACELLIAGRAVVCGKYRAMDGMLLELLRDPVTGYTAIGKDLYWIEGGDVSSIYVVDAEATPVAN